MTSQIGISLFLGPPVVVKCGFYIVSFGSISELNMVSSVSSLYSTIELSLRGYGPKNAIRTYVLRVFL